MLKKCIEHLFILDWNKKIYNDSPHYGGYHVIICEPYVAFSILITSALNYQQASLRSFDTVHDLMEPMVQMMVIFDKLLYHKSLDERQHHL